MDSIFGDRGGLIMDISKNDWKLFQERLPGWQERYMANLLQEYSAIIAQDSASSDRFWALDERIKRDKKSPGVIMSPSKSDLPWDLARMIHEGIISMEDLSGFSQDLLDGINLILRR